VGLLRLLLHAVVQQQRERVLVVHVEHRPHQRENAWPRARARMTE
jgi:hypothetical protein